jgi:hypothetical protein
LIAGSRSYFSVMRNMHRHTVVPRFENLGSKLVSLFVVLLLQSLILLTPTPRVYAYNRGVVQ